MSIVARATDRLFERLAFTYGNTWARMWEGMPIADVKSQWGSELSWWFENRMDAIAWALENLAPKAPNIIEFKNLCRQAPVPDVPRLPEPKADPQRLAAELSKLGQLRSHVASAERPGAKDWAHRIAARHAAGERINTCTLRMAREALGVARA